MIVVKKKDNENETFVINFSFVKIGKYVKRDNNLYFTI